MPKGKRWIWAPVTEPSFDKTGKLKEPVGYNWKLAPAQTQDNGNKIEYHRWDFLRAKLEKGGKVEMNIAVRALDKFAVFAARIARDIDTGKAKVYLYGPFYIDNPSHKNFLKSFTKELYERVKVYDEKVLQKLHYEGKLNIPPKNFPKLNAAELRKKFQEAALSVLGRQFHFDLSKLIKKSTGTDLLVYSAGVTAGVAAYQISPDTIKPLLKLSGKREIFKENGIIKRNDALKAAVTYGLDFNGGRAGLQIEYLRGANFSFVTGVEQSFSYQGKFFKQLQGTFGLKYSW